MSWEYVLRVQGLLELQLFVCTVYDTSRHSALVARIVLNDDIIHRLIAPDTVPEL